MVWLGLLGYLLYTYIGAAFAYHLNPFFPIYVALFALTMSAIVTLATSVGHEAGDGIEGRALPRWPTALFLALVAAMVAIPEIARIAAYLKTGEIPDFIVQTGSATRFVYTLDLGVVAPLCVLSAVWLWRRRPWGDVLGGCMLVKGVAMGCALLATDAFTLGAGREVDFALTGIYGMIAVASLAMSAWFFSRWRA